MRILGSGAIAAAMTIVGMMQVSAKSSAETAGVPDNLQLASVSVSVRPVSRPKSEVVPVVASGEPFQTWLQGFRVRASEAGISARTMDAALTGITPDPKVVERDRNQSEFTKTIWDYLDSAASDARIRNGRTALDRHRALLQQIEEEYGVEKEIVTAIWGLESAYGSFRGGSSTIRSLATLAHDPRRAAFFESELIAALQILESGDVSAANMKGSWAGAMGHTQFMPSSFQKYAVDFTGDGKRDIWSDDPADALASAASYLAGFGWTSGQPWGVEIQLPDGFDYATARREITRSPSQWAAMGVVDMQGRAVADHGAASILLPAGEKGAAFMIFDNFEVLEKYNTADAYVIGVGHLADRIAGASAIQSEWPRGDRALTLKERMEMQQLLTESGFDTEGIDGKIGPLTINAVRQYQLAQGLVPDGYASLRLLERLR